MHQNLPASGSNCTGSNVLLIRISTRFDVDLCVTCLNFQTGSIWEDLVNVITLHKLLVSSCNLIVDFSSSKSWKSSILTFVWLANFQTCSRSGYLVNILTAQKLHASCCNCTEIFSTTKSRTSLMLTFVWPFVWTRSSSNGSILQLLVNMIMPQKLPA